MSRANREYHYSKKRKDRVYQKEKLIKKKKMISSIKQLMTQGKYQKAYREINYYLEQYPNDSYGLFQKASILMEFGKDYYDEAEDIFTDIIESNLKSKYSSYYKLGMMALEKSNLLKAEEYFRKNIEESPYSEMYSRVELSHIEKGKGNYEGAYKILVGSYDRKIDSQEPINKYPASFLECDQQRSNIYYYLAKLMIDMRRFDDALEYMKKIDLEYPRRDFKRSCALLYAEIYAPKKKYEESISCINQALVGEKTGIYFKASVYLAKLKCELGEIEESMLLCKKIIDTTDYESSSQETVDFYKTSAKMILANNYQNLGEFDQAKKIYEEIQQSSSEKEKYNYYLGVNEFERKNYHEAYDYFKKAKFKNKVSQNKNVIYQVFTLIKLGEFKLAYQMTQGVKIEYLSSSIQDEFKFALFYLKQKLGISNQNMSSYLINQIINYQEGNMIDHIARVHEKDGSVSQFHEDIDLHLLANQIPELVKRCDSKMIHNKFLEGYEIPFSSLGVDNGADTTHLRAVCLPNVEGIITMFPIKLCEKEPLEVQVTVQKKKVSQVDKFYQKYGKK